MMSDEGESERRKEEEIQRRENKRGKREIK